jgi:HlyD family secretion protein
MGAVAFLAFNRLPISVRVASPERNVLVRVFGLGTVEARVTSKVSFEVGAAIIELKADHGDRVKKGDVLARLNATAQRAKFAKSKADALSAEVAVKKAEANVEKARAVLAQRRAVNERKKQLASRGFVSQQAVEEAQRDEDVSKADLTVATREVEVARAQVEDVRAQYQFENAILDYHTLYAPFDAIVVDRLKELGSVIRAGDPIFTLTDPDSVWALAYVDEARAGWIKEGQPAEVRLRSRPDLTYQARVVRIGIESDRVNEERRVYVKCEHCPGNLQLGEQAEILITVATLSKALLVPESAVQAFDGTKGNVWTVENGQLERRHVTFRHRTEDARLEVIGGVPEGALVAIENGAAFTSGRLARPVSQAQP